MLFSRRGEPSHFHLSLSIFIINFSRTVVVAVDDFSLIHTSSFGEIAADEPMTCFGSKALQSGRLKAHHHNSVGDSQMGTVQEEISNSFQGEGEDGRKKKKQNRRPRKEHHSSSSLRLPDNFAKSQKSSKHHNTSISLQPSVLRKQVDPETTKYFSEIANIFEGTGVDIEERSVICGNALEETRGKELELATDYIISHTLQALLEGSDVDQLCGFLRSCAEDFPHIAMDRSGSHVAETALRSLNVHLQEKEAHAIIEETLTKICQVIAVKSVDVMCSRYGSHVLRSLLCLCKGIPLDSAQEFHVTKSSAILAERLNTRETKSVGNNPQNLQKGFPNLLKFLVMEMLKCAWEDIATLQVNQYSSLVLQTALKVLVGEDQELMQIIPILLGCHGESHGERSLLQTVIVQDTMGLLNDNAFSHLMEVILEVAPETLYNEMLTKMFRNMLFEISSHHYGSFVIQALVSSATRQDHMDLVWTELGGKFKELLEIGRTGVIASILAASQRLHTHEQKFSEALATAVCSATESISCIVPRILFLESYFVCGDKAGWKWEKGDKMHVLGCLMLQTVFRYPSEFIQPYIKSLVSMEADLVLEAAKDAGAGRVIESFLSSKASTKHKHKLIVKLRGHFGELSMRPSGSFTVEKCFTASTASLRETIASELLAVWTELSKTKQGPHLLRKLDVDGFATQPVQWRSRQVSKQAAYKEFYAAFGPSKTKSNETFSAEPSSSRCSPPKSVKKMRKEIDQYLATSSTLGSNFPGLDASMAKLGFRGFKRRPVCTEEWGSKKFAKLDVVGGDGLKWKKKEWIKNRKGGGG